MTINFSIDVQPHQVNNLLTALAGVLGPKQPEPQPATTVDPPAQYKRSEPEKAVKPSPANTEKAVKPSPANTEKAVERTAPEPEAEEKAAPSYSITTIRAKAKEVAAVKGNGFLRECLDGVGASSISTIAEDRYGEFMKA
ncbi:MAG: hypothetical protein EOM14_17030, partial [Clostridia bacterium]|nr:hypothetical protein [Clostridia bacterium]